LAALAGSLDRNAATVDDPQFCHLGIRFNPAIGSQQRGDLLAFVLVDLTAEGLDGECSHAITVLNRFSNDPGQRGNFKGWSNV
jgi:hypothetical protein